MSSMLSLIEEIQDLLAHPVQVGTWDVILSSGKSRHHAVIGKRSTGEEVAICLTGEVGRGDDVEAVSTAIVLASMLNKQMEVEATNEKSED